jgi:hypothetical protein
MWRGPALREVRSKEMHVAASRGRYCLTSGTCQVVPNSESGWQFSPALIHRPTVKPFHCAFLAVLLGGCTMTHEPRTHTSASTNAENLRVVITDWQTQRDRERRAREELRTNYVATHTQLTPEIREMILKGQVNIGMTTNDVVAAWGEPDRRTHSQYTFGTADFWTYGGTHLSFQNGVLKSWTQSQ